MGGGAAGRRGDFLTSPELGPLFGAVVARALDRWWDELGRPDPFVVVDAGAGAGTLAAAVLAARPASSAALRYVMVERSETLRRRQRLPLEPAGLVLGPAVASDPEEEPRSVPGAGPLVASLAELPARPFSGVVLANELLDNLAFRLLQRSGDAQGRHGDVERHQNGGEAPRWSEVRVGERLEECLVPASPEDAVSAERLAPDAPGGARIPVQEQAGGWLRAALRCLRRGRVVVFDYADSTPSMARRPWTEWVRTYRGHARGGHPLEDPGHQDVTCEVAVDQLAHVRPPSSESSQAQFLRAHGIDDLVTDARAAWARSAARPDLDALAALARVNESAALTDPAGLGAFRVLEWTVP